jgi:cyclic pyranopterin phosphate synthase
MVEVGKKEETEREAVAEGRIWLSQEVISRIKEGRIEKGDVFCVSKVAGIVAAKQTSSLIPLCHNIEITGLEIEHELERDGIRVVTHVRAKSRTGVEMEALLACSVALLTIYDMCKSYGYGMEISGVRLLEKRGGKSGDWRLEVEGRGIGGK